MATIKSFTSLEQSRKLAEILPLESADMHYRYDNDFHELESIPTITEEDDHFILFPEDVRCWSLAALMNIIEKIEKVEICFSCSSNKYWVNVHFETFGSFCQDHELYDSKIDALIALIKKLKKRNLL